VCNPRITLFHENKKQASKFEAGFFLLMILEVWKFGSLEVWKFGSLEVWKFGSLEVWKFGSLERPGRKQ
jgi:hypothetical protein